MKVYRRLDNEILSLKHESGYFQLYRRRLDAEERLTRIAMWLNDPRDLREWDTAFYARYGAIGRQMQRELETTQEAGR